MQAGDIERIERTVMSLVVQAFRDYWDQAVTIFQNETDLPQDIAEDITREAIASIGVSGTHDRLYGKVDVKKAIYAFIPEPVPVALMLDAKAEKPNGNRTATIQMSQTSMHVRMVRQGKDVDIPGKLEPIIPVSGRDYRAVTVIAKFIYNEEPEERHSLSHMIIACIPSGDLQDRYNPTSSDTIWSAGRNAPTLGEEFRVRLNYEKLREKSDWRVQKIENGRKAPLPR